MTDTAASPPVLSLDEKRRLLAVKLQEKTGRETRFPLSFAQQRLWLVQQLDPASTAYNMLYPVRLRGALDGELLARALTALVRRHETLRTVFPAEGGVAVQRVLPAAPVVPREVDLRHLDPGAREAEAARRAAEEAGRPFDLAAGLLLRVSVLRMDADDAVVLLAMHHIVSDGWSQDVLARDLSELYTALAEGRAPVLPPLPIQYADFAAWQRGWLTGAVLEEQVAYWRARLAGAPPLLELRTDHPRTAAAGARAAYASFVLPAGVSEALRVLSRREGATLFMTLLAAFQVVLARHAGQDDVVVGVPVAGRSRVELENLVGFFVNMLALRTDLSGDPAFRALLARVREGMLQAHAHEHVPFEKLIEELQPERDPTHPPVFQVSFTVEGPRRETLKLGALRAVPDAGGRDEQAKFDLSLSMAERDGRITGSLAYRTDLFERATAERMTGHLARVLEQVAADPDVRLSRIDLLTADERARVVDAWNRTEVAYPRDASVHRLFEARVREAPNAVALVSDEETLTYRALNGRANRLARRLVRRGAGPEARVGICLEHGVEMIVSVLAVLKAGAAYVPLDPAYPPDRLALMAADAGVAALVTRQALRTLVPVSAGVAVLVMDGAGDSPDSTRGTADREADAGETADFETGDLETAELETADLAIDAGPRSLAYVMYTSGSTGTPKGVAVEHRSVVRLVRGAGYIRFGADEVFLQAAPVSFDASTLEIWGALLNGARLALLPGGAPSLESLGGAVVRHGVTTLWLTAGLFQLVARERLDDLRGVRQLLSGGDVLPVEAVRALRDRFPACRVVNGYGPTENTTFTCCHTVADAWSGGPVPIGAPIANTRAYVLDAGLRPVPVGVPGELYAGGDGVARGYLGRPGLTAERFVPDPFSTRPGARMYRTGDRARWLADGTVEFLGRLDAQAKIRGFRIEPGEIEAVLSSHPAVRQARVVVREDVPGDKRLVAYVAAGGREAGDAQSGAADLLRAHLRARLPKHMVPEAFVVLDHLPLSANGKVDTRALPAPERAPSADAHVPPRTPTEEVLAEIWAGVLRVERVGALDDFFERGGHSLLAMLVVSRVGEAFGVELPLPVLFEASTVAELAARVDALRRADVPPLPPVVPVEPGRPLPLSFAQERLWFLDRLRPGSTAYNVPAALRLSGALDAASLERAVGEVVRRHDALRTTLVQVDGTPVQVVAPFAGFVLPVEDLSDLGDEAEREAALRRRVAEEASRPFNLAAGPLFRAALLRLGAEEHVLLLCMHHVVSDGWSMGVLYRELAALYAAYRAGGASPLPDLPVQYADHAVWQRERLRGQALDRQLAYWRDRLAGAPELLELPTDLPRPPAPGFRGGMAEAELPAELLERLRALARAEGATLYMVVLAAFQVLLSKHSGMDDVVVGSPVAGRTRHEVEGLIGFFVNTLVLRTDLSGDPAFRDVVRRVRQATLGAYEHQDVPFERLVAELRPERSMSHAPLFQVMFSLDDAAHAPAALPGLAVRPVDAGLVTAKFDLSLGLSVTPRGLAAGLVYSTDLFQARTAERMLSHLARLLEQVAAAPERRLSTLELVTEAERARIVGTWSGTDVAHPAERPVHVLVAEQAARAPDAVAVVYGDASLSYGALDARAGRLARRLVRLGVGAEARVGICLERGPDLVVAALAVLKAGGAYVPLDPAHPADRLGFMLADSGAAVLLTHEALRGAVALPPGVAVVTLDARADALAADAGDAEDAPLPVVTARSLAYVIYTSGSTGTPKGVAVEHGALASLCAWHARAFAVTAADRATQLAGPGFDAAVWELWPYLACGASVAVAPEAVRTDPVALRDWLVRTRATVAFVPTPVAEPLLALPWPREGALRWLLTGGDRLRARPGAELPFAVSNNYGPTECTVVATSGTVRPEGTRAPSIGGPVDHTRVYVLDAWMRPVPDGVPGELYVGGAPVARGYLGRPALTAERFVPDPFASAPGARLYRTGDRARWNADATLDFLGRVDAQVKIRGFRIEPGEVERALATHPAVRQARVIVREDAGDRRLVAYVVGDLGDWGDSGDGGSGADPSGELRAHLRQRLPDYMVPAAFVVLDGIPLTPNGKVDVRALPAPERAGSAVGYVAPRTPTEEVLAAIWAEVLEVDRVGAADRFFDLGGHSLLATRLMSRVREVFGAELPLRALFDGPTVAELARAVDDAAGRAASPPVAVLARGEGASDFPLSFAQQRLWVVHQMDPEGIAYNMPYALRLRGTLDVDVLGRALTALVRRHETLRTVFPEHGGVPVQRVLPAGPVPLEVADLRALSEDAREAEAARLARAEAARPFRLSSGPLLRVTLLRLADADALALFTLHHVVSDGWSHDVLVRDLSALYAAEAEGGAPALPPLPVQYADYAAWQREWLRGDVLEAHLAWWRERLAGAPHLLELPTDRPRPPAPSDRAARAPLALSAETTRALRALSRGEGATLFMTLLAAFQAVLSRWAGQEDVTVGTPVAGRTRPEVENLVGFFVNLLALRTDLSGDPAFRALLGRVREGVLEAHARQDVPFETLVDELRAERTPAVTPFFQVLFALQPPARESLRLGGLEIAPAGAGVDAAKYDLSLEMADDGERLGGSLLYRTDLFDPATAARLMDHLARVLAQVTADPDVPLSRLALLDPAERARVVEAWNRTAAPYPADRCIHQLFQDQAARTPDAPAVLSGEDALTYGQLDEKANRLARHLVRRGVGPEVRVGLCLERGLELMACILGVMKAGGAYVPVDPSHPAERIGYVFGDAGVSVVLTQQRLADRLSLDAGVPVLAVDAMADELEAEPAGAPVSAVTSENLCYVIYTSGSTGRPKGVAMHHRGVANYIDWGIRFYGADAGSGAPVFSSMAVDLTITNLLPLFAGLPVRFLPEANPVEALAEVLRTAPDFGLIKITPVHLSLLTPMLTPEEARRAARTLVIGADFLPAEPTVWWQEHAPGVRLMNEYGPTETVVGCSAYVLPNGLHRHGPVPVGGAIQNLTFFVLDARMEPVPVGLPGELYIGGAGVARGYLGRPGLSAEKFVPDPFAAHAGARMYRTGDRARWLEGGNLMILGRTDHQVKIRGYRVELGEIEAVLRRHPDVSGCLVVVREDRPGDRRLVAYVVAGADDRALREHLRTSLPEYMVPAAFVRLETLPKTATGKVDPKTLPAPEYGSGEARYVAPRTPVEATLAKVWAEVLGVERVGVDDVFFELGGDSILAIQAASRARWAGVEVTPRQVLEHRTVAGVAAAVERGEGAGAHAAEQGRVAGPVALTPIQAAFFAREHPAVAHHNLSVVMAVDAAVTDAVLRTALRAVLEHHDALRLRYRRTDAGWEQWHADEHGITLERADLSGIAPGERDAAQEAVARRWQASLDLEHGPLGRTVLLDRGEEGRVLFFVLHHLLVDGVSWRILREDLDRACAQAARSEPVDLGPKSTSFQAWARALEAYAAGDALGQADFWLAQGADGVPPLPVDGQGVPDMASALVHTVSLTPGETRLLLQEVPAAYGAQINDVLLSALADAVGAWTGGTRMRVALESHGRAEEVGGGVELTRSVGWFTSVYPVVLDTAGAASPAERLARVQAQLRAVPAHGVGYGALRWMSRDTDLRGALAAHPEPEIVFNYLGQFDEGLAPGMGVRFAGGPRGLDVAEVNRLVYPLTVAGHVIAGRLSLHWRYGAGAHRPETIERVANACLRALRSLIAHAAGGAPG